MKNELLEKIGEFNVAMASVKLDHLQIKQDMDVKELFNRFDTLGNLSIFGNEIKVFKQSKVIRELLKLYKHDVLNLLELQGVNVNSKEFKENAFTLCCDLVSVYKNKVITKGLGSNVIKVYMVAVCSRLLEHINDDVFGVVDYTEKGYLKTLQESVNVAIDEIVENYIAEHIEPLDLNEGELSLQENIDTSTLSEIHEHGLSLMEMDTWDYPAITYFNNLQFAPNLLDPIDLPEIEQSAIEYKQLLRNAIKNDLPIELEFDDGDTIELSVDLMNRILECDIFDMYKVMNASSLDEFMQLLSAHIPFYKSITKMIDNLDDDDLQEHVVLQQLQTIAESKLQDMIVNLLEMTGVNDIAVADNAVIGSVNRKHFGGKIDIVNRVRDGKVQLRKRVSNAKGFRIKDGKIVKMTFAEKKKRKVGARIASRKRKVIMARILKKRAKSLLLRQRRLGD